MTNVSATGDCQIVTMRWGGHFRAAHVNALKRQIERHLSRPSEFVCITDDGAGLDPDIVVKPIPAEFLSRPELQHGVFWKMALYKPGLLRAGVPTMFLDLDSVVVGPLDRLFDDLDADRSALFIMSNVAYGAKALMFPFAPRYFLSLMAACGLRNMRQGNSSLLVYYPEHHYNLYETLIDDLSRSRFDAIRGRYDNDQRYVCAKARRLRLVSPRLCREFVRHFEGWLAPIPLFKAKTVAPPLAIITFNGALKPERLLAEPQKYAKRFSREALDWLRSVWSV